MRARAERRGEDGGDGGDGGGRRREALSSGGDGDDRVESMVIIWSGVLCSSVDVGTKANPSRLACG